MSWGYRLRIPEGARANGIDKVLPYEKRVVTAGKLIPFLERVKGRPSWGAARYGLNLYSGHSGKLFWNAKKESLRTNETWSRLMRMRIAIPVDAYVESSPTRCWMTGPAAWVPGLYDPSVSGGIVTITEALAEGGGRPLLLDQKTAIRWLDATQWNALAVLEQGKVQYEMADIFVSARLDAESKSKVPIAA
tara:strand:- start:1013 stop:1585 length:573 start_codon:yes stop_codon:yes gene_type:complete